MLIRSTQLPEGMLVDCGGGAPLRVGPNGLIADATPEQAARLLRIPGYNRVDEPKTKDRPVRPDDDPVADALAEVAPVPPEPEPEPEPAPVPKPRGRKRG